MLSILLYIGLSGASDKSFWDNPQYQVEEGKLQIDPLIAEACEDIRDNLSSYRKGKLAKATQYFTPIFEPNSEGFLRPGDRRACLNVEGSCVVGQYLYNYPNTRYRRADVAFIFGKGAGRSEMWNTTNALDPCRTVAADRRKHPQGTVIFVPSMVGKICPQSGAPVDGCFIVGDVGSAIRGFGRFDFFTGECSDYSKRSNVCRDKLNNQYQPEKKADFYIINRHNKRAKALREEADLHINMRWGISSF